MEPCVRGHVGHRCAVEVAVRVEAKTVAREQAQVIQAEAKDHLARPNGGPVPQHPGLDGDLVAGRRVDLRHGHRDRRALTVKANGVRAVVASQRTGRAKPGRA